MKVIKIIGIAIVLAIGLYLLIAALAPKAFNVQRKLLIKASPETVFYAVNSFQQWENWSPWLQKDTTIKNTYSGPPAGVGNKVSWTSKHSGYGSNEIVEAVPGKFIHTRLSLNNFTPFESVYTFNAFDSGTEVTINDKGDLGFLWRPMNLFADKMMGSDFEKAMENLKKYVETKPKWKLGEYKIEELPVGPILCVLDSCPAEQIGEKLGALYGEIGAVMQKNKMDFTGPVMAYYYTYGPERVVLEAAVPVAKEIKGEGRVKGRTVGKTKALSVSFFGDYGFMTEAMPVIKTYMKANNFELNGPECEVYITDPGTVTDKSLVETKIYFPVK